MGVRVDDRSVRIYFNGMFARSSDLSGVLKWAGRELEKANVANFASQGSVSGHPWDPLDPDYARWKMAHYGPAPMLVQSGALLRSLSYFSRRGPNFIRTHEAVFGTSVDYAKYHQTGTRFMPRRKIIFVPKFFEMRLAEQVGDEVVYGKTGTLRKVKSAVTS